MILITEAVAIDQDVEWGRILIFSPTWTISLKTILAEMYNSSFFIHLFVH